MRGCQDGFNSLSIASWPVSSQGENRLALYFPLVKLPCQQCCRYLWLNYQLQRDLNTQQLQVARFLWEEKFGLSEPWQPAPGQVIIIEFQLKLSIRIDILRLVQSVSINHFLPLTDSQWLSDSVTQWLSDSVTQWLSDQTSPFFFWRPEQSPAQPSACWSCENKSGLIFINHYKVLAEEIH